MQQQPACLAEPQHSLAVCSSCELAGSECGVCAHRPDEPAEAAEQGVRHPRPSAAADESGAAEHMMLGALQTLYADASEADVQLGILRVVLQLLQRHGGHRSNLQPDSWRSSQSTRVGCAVCLVCTCTIWLRDRHNSLDCHGQHAVVPPPQGVIRELTCELLPSHVTTV